MRIRQLFVVLAIVALAALFAAEAWAHPAHWESFWVQDYPGYWDSVPIELPDGRLRYVAKWVPPSGHTERTLVHEPHQVVVVPIPLPGFVRANPCGPRPVYHHPRRYPYRW